MAHGEWPSRMSFASRRRLADVHATAAVPSGETATTGRSCSPRVCWLTRISEDPSKALVNRRLTVPANAVAQAVENAREDGTQIRRKPTEIFDNSFAEQLDKSGFLKELWGNQL